jgi:hypothetical protein
LRTTIDSLNESKDHEFAKLLGDPDLQLPVSIKIVCGTLPDSPLLKLCDRVPCNFINLDALEYKQNCREDLVEFIQDALSDVDISSSEAPESSTIKSDIFAQLSQSATNYRYAWYALQSIKNGTLSVDKIGTDLPNGITAHYQIHFDSKVAENWSELKPILEMLVASPLPLRKTLIQEALDGKSVSPISILGGYIVDSEGMIFIDDSSLIAWLTDADSNTRQFYCQS